MAHQGIRKTTERFFLFPIRTSHAPSAALNAPSDTHQCNGIIEYLQPMYKCYKIYVSADKKFQIHFTCCRGAHD
jgi:hypothetical protein